MGNYEIKSGDCLWNITKNHFKDTLSDSEIAQKVNELAKANNISNPDLIYAGKELDLSCFSEYKTAKNNPSFSSISIWGNTETKDNTSVNDLFSIQKSNEVTLPKLSSGNIEFDFNENMSNRQKRELKSFKKNFEKNKAKYEKVEQETGVPAELVAAIHWRESSGNFKTYLHNGEKLGKVTQLVPKGIYFEDWTEAAIHAIKTHNPEIVDSNNIETWYEFAERYNGLGYRNRGVSSPYVWAGTDNYTSGKYVADGKYSADYVDQQLGVALMLKSLLA